MTTYLSKRESIDMWDEAIKYRDENDKTKKNIDIDHNNPYYKIEKCKICKIEVKLSCKYDGNYPLCDKHRQPNDRFKLKQNK